MSKSTPKSKFIPALCGRDYTRLDSGLFVVAHNHTNPFAPYAPTNVPLILDDVDHAVELKKKEYRHRLEAVSADIRRLTFDHLVKSEYALIVGMAGYDGAGKSGGIKKLSKALGGNSKEFAAVSYGKPDPVERLYPHYKRFFDYERFPKRGQIRALDRFWYERMAVERVRELAPLDDLNRGYSELNMLEYMLTQNKIILLKFFLSITKEEQDKRFAARAASATQEKLSPDDLEAQKKRPQYKRAFNEMFWRNGTDYAPWHVIAAENKHYSRVILLETIAAKLKEVLGVK